MSRRRTLNEKATRDKEQKVKVAHLISATYVLDSGALQPRKWQLIGTGCSTAAHSPR